MIGHFLHFSSPTPHAYGVIAMLARDTRIVCQLYVRWII